VRRHGQLDAVVVRSGTERDERRDTTASKTVVTRDDLNRYGDTSVADVLGRVPGVTMSGSRCRGTEVRMGGLDVAAGRARAGAPGDDRAGRPLRGAEPHATAELVHHGPRHPGVRGSEHP
jgi:hypothetical protein